MLQVSRESASARRVPGVDRVLWLRLQVHDGHSAGAVVHGVRHRRPVDVPVGVATAARLVRAGVPAVRVAV